MSIRYNPAVMASRREPPDSLDYFPTPPWATRALFVHVLRELGLTPNIESAWEPACGEGHMAAVMAEWARHVVASDVFDYGYGRGVVDFLDPAAGGVFPPCDWIITNPPFVAGHAFATLALERAVDGVALLVRSVWTEGVDRWRYLFEPRPPAAIAQFVERVPMVKGRWDPSAKTATAYCWVVWLKHAPPGAGTKFVWIPPCRAELTRPDDIARFAPLAPAPLLEG